MKEKMVKERQKKDRSKERERERERENTEADRQERVSHLILISDQVGNSKVS